MHAKHKGHEAMHMEMILVLLISLVLCQFVLLIWRNFHLRSYQVENCFFSLIDRWSKKANSFWLVFYSHRHVVNSVVFIGQIFLFSFYYHLDLFYTHYILRHTTSDKTTNWTEYAKVKANLYSIGLSFFDDDYPDWCTNGFYWSIKSPMVWRSVVIFWLWWLFWG